MRKTVAFSKNATNVFFHILTQCNLKCKHCYINPKHHGANKLSLETIGEWLKLFVKKSASANVIFLGGEPTLHPDLALAVKKAKDLGYQSITIDTNGYLFHDILAKVTPQMVDYFSFSLDGASPETNDAIRGEGSYDTCINGIKKAVQKGFRVSLIYTVSRINLQELKNMRPLILDLGIDRFFIQVIGVRGRSVDIGQDQLQVSRSEWLNIIPSVAKEIAHAGVTVVYPKVFLGTDDAFECAGLVAENYFIFPNGRVYRCPLCEDFPLHGELIKDNILIDTPKINEKDFFSLNIPEGCVMNKLIQPGNLSYDGDGTPKYKIACCMLKEEVLGER